MSESKNEELNRFFDLLVLVAEELSFSGAQNLMLEEIEFMSRFSEVKHFGPYDVPLAL